MPLVDKFSLHRLCTTIWFRCARLASRWLQEALAIIFVCLGLLTAASGSTDDVAGCTNALDLKGAISACTKIIESNWASDFPPDRARTPLAIGAGNRRRGSVNDASA